MRLHGAGDLTSLGHGPTGPLLPVLLSHGAHPQQNQTNSARQRMTPPHPPSGPRPAGAMAGVLRAFGGSLTTLAPGDAMYVPAFWVHDIQVQKNTDLVQNTCTYHSSASLSLSRSNSAETNRRAIQTEAADPSSSLPCRFEKGCFKGYVKRPRHQDARP